MQGTRSCDSIGSLRNYVIVLILYLGFGPVDEEEFFRSAGEGGVEPVDVVGGEHVVGHVALVYIDM